MPTLRETAISAAAERRSRQADAEAEAVRARAARIRRQFVDDFDCQPDFADDCKVVMYERTPEVEPTTLRYMQDVPVDYTNYWWELWGLCPLCEAEAWSMPVRDLADLGELLVGFRHPRCPGESDE